MRTLTESERQLIRDSGLFDAAWYAEKYRDVAATGLDPLEHFLQIGIQIGRAPRERFDTLEHRQENKLLDEPVVPYLEFWGILAPESGGLEAKEFQEDSESFIGLKQNDGDLLDKEFYLSCYPDVRDSGIDPNKHYTRHGKNEGRIPSIRLKYPKSFIKRKETILLVTHEASLTGAPILSWNLTQSFLKKYNVVLITFGEGEMLGQFCKIGAFEIGPINHQASEIIVRKINHLNPRFAIVNSIESRHILESLAELEIPSVALLHEFYSYTHPRDAFHNCILHATTSVFSTKATASNLIARCPELTSCNFLIEPQGKCEIPTIKDSEGKINSFYIEENRIDETIIHKASNIIIGLGTVQYRKGVDLFIECARHILSLESKLFLKFLWFGDGFNPEKDMHYSCYLQEQIKSMGLERNVEICKSTKNLKDVYDKASILLVTSRLDPLPNVAIDAMTNGIPLLCFDRINGIAEHIEKAGLRENCISQPFDTGSMARQAISLLNDEDIRQKVSEVLKKYSNKYFNFSKYADRLSLIAEEAVKKTTQMAADMNYIHNSNEFRVDFFAHTSMCNSKLTKTSLSYIREFIKASNSGVAIRKPCPGFNPLLYPAINNSDGITCNSFAQYIRDGKPLGPWRNDILELGKSNNSLCHKNEFSTNVALHIHCYYKDMFLDILELINKNISSPDLFISVPDEPTREHVLNQISMYSGKTVSVDICPNRGRDLGPLLTMYSRIILDRYEYVGHFHTKKSIGNAADKKTISEWYHFLKSNLLSYKNIKSIDEILAFLKSNTHIGIIFPDDPNLVNWSSNFNLAQEIAANAGIKINNKSFNFPIGSMFWARTTAISNFLNLNFAWSDYPQEPIPNDGTILHALERLIPFFAIDAGFSLATTNIHGVTR
jgi:glycosyltransferase involved in cell wall biosynthesis